MADTDSSSSSTDISSLLASLGTTAATGGASGGLALIPSLWKLGAGLFQGIKANKLANTPRPVYNPPAYSIPPEVQQYLDKTQNRMLDPNLPGQSIMEQKLGANTSNATQSVMQSGHGSGDILNTIAKIYGNQNDATNNLGITAAQNYQNLVQKKDSDVSQALLTSAGYKDKKYASDLDRYKGMFDYNQADPFSQAMGSSSALRNASGRNLYGSANDLSSIATLMSILKRQQGKNPNTAGGSGNNTGMWDYTPGNAAPGTLVNQDNADNLG